MTSVAKTAVSRLRRALVVAHLEVEFALVGPQLGFRERPLVLVGHFWSQRRSIVLWVLLGDAPQSEKRQRHLENHFEFRYVSKTRHT